MCFLLRQNANYNKRQKISKHLHTIKKFCLSLIFFLLCNNNIYLFIIWKTDRFIANFSNLTKLQFILIKKKKTSKTFWFWKTDRFTVSLYRNFFIDNFTSNIFLFMKRLNFEINLKKLKTMKFWFVSLVKNHTLNLFFKTVGFTKKFCGNIFVFFRKVYQTLSF